MAEIQTSVLAPGWWLVGNGPSYLLFRSPQKEVMHLCTGLHRELRQSLKGYGVIQEDDTLTPLVQMLIMTEAHNAIYGNEYCSPYKLFRSKWAGYGVLHEIEELIRSAPQREIFEERLRRLCTSFRAAGQYLMYHGSPGALGAFDGGAPPGSSFFYSPDDQYMLGGTPPERVYVCDPTSQIARCVQELWQREGDRFRAQTSLYYVPTRKELCEHLCLDEPAITKLCRREGFGWLPQARPGRKPKRGSSSPKN